jgi:hypothetical protein
MRPKSHNTPQPGALRHTHLWLHAQDSGPQARRPPLGPQHAPHAQTSLAIRRRATDTRACVGDRAGRIRTVVLRHGRDIGPVLAVLVNVSSSAVAGRGAWVLAFPYMHAMAHGGAGSCALHRGEWRAGTQGDGLRVAGRGGPGQGAVKRVTPQLAAAECAGCCSNGVSFVVVTNTGASVSSACRQHMPCPAHSTRTARAHARRGAAPAVASACTSRRHAERRRRRRGHRRVGCAAACCLVNETQQPGGCTSAARRTSVLACVPGGRRIRHGGGRSRASAARRVARWVCDKRRALCRADGCMNQAAAARTGHTGGQPVE